MKTLHPFLAITAAAVLSADPAHAQLLGGGIGGSMSNTMGGALSGSMIDRSGTVDGRFGSNHSLRTADNVEAQPNVSAPITRTEKTSARAIENEKQSAAVAEHSAAGKAESSGRTALNDGASAVHAGKAEAGEVKSAGTARAEEASKAPQPQSRVNATNRQAEGSDVGVRTPPAQANADGGAANNTHASGGTAGWSAGSQTASGADASASVER